MPAPLSLRQLLSIRQLGIAFEGEEGLSPGVEGIDLEVRRGEIVALVGESGSGKSITALSILQLLPSPPAKYISGEILFTGRDGRTIDLLKQETSVLLRVRGAEIGMIFQEPMTSLNPVFTCGDQVAEAIRAHSQVSAAEARRMTVALFGQVQLPDPEGMYSRWPHQLSGGQKQRVMIAMAMSSQPLLLICDEPTTALDVTVQKTILQLIRQLQSTADMGVIFITHDLGVVAEVADRALVLYNGKVVESGPVEELFRHPSHAYTRKLLQSRPALLVKEERVAMSDKVLLRAEDVRVWYPARKTLLGKVLEWRKAVDGVSFDVYAGETLGLVGESGCGKTTLGRALLRLVEPTGGRVLFGGVDIGTLGPGELKRLRSRMQLIFQDPYSSLNPRLSAGEAISEAMKVHGIGGSQRQRREAVVDLLEKVSLKAEHYGRKPHEFSGGQRQRIVIARALAVRPDFIVADESVSALDVSVQAQVLNLLNDLKAAFGFTIVFISHDLSVIRYMSDRILVMNKGRIEESGEAEEVYGHPRSEYTKKLIASIPVIR
jgi:peptide/nickel transport system ATP-binding protein